ncbi:uncharacterized protein B0P05DRAFT_590311 [Gilbertella persicaria]|uniref:uncharacterized protein n=1 Tax=Gilbertella persicaria TaxID=101096 RepID=UPI002220619D|nr:uncharacterized protein B0P05DRAFT_590311 [Gilbertella persicaria]KAI8063372.1 hypothetical protein B0P05DRAFT_590311 [Gilbertella persicaria]
MNEKRTSPPPPKYEHIIKTSPPPPSYIQSTVRLQYKNQPYITDLDQVAFRSQYLEFRPTDTMSDIAQWPLRQRLVFYLKTWATTAYDGRLIFFAFFVVGSLVTMGLVVSFIALPSLIKH